MYESFYSLSSVVQYYYVQYDIVEVTATVFFTDFIESK